MPEQNLTLADLPPGQSGRVVRLDTQGPVRRRLLDMGLVPGTRVKSIRLSPAGDPAAYGVRGTIVAIRRADASEVLVEAEGSIQGEEHASGHLE